MRKHPALTTLTCLIRIGEDAPGGALAQAVALAKAQDAHLSVHILAAEVSVPFSPMGVSVVSSAVEQLNETVRTQGSDAKDKADHTIKVEGISSDTQMLFGALEVIALQAATRARAVDLVVVDQPSAALDTKGLVLEEALFRSGRPVLVAVKGQARGEFHRAMIAWDGSAHAARAVGDALALFPTLRKLEIVSVAGEKDLKKSLPGADLAQHLARKGIETVLTELPLGKEGVAKILNRHAESSGAELMIMGGFGHSRLREFLFGGVTVYLTEHACVPLLMAY